MPQDGDGEIVVRNIATGVDWKAPRGYRPPVPPPDDPGTNLAEFHSGYMLYSRRLLEQAPFEQLQNNFNFDAEMIILAHLLGYRCREIPIPTRYDDETSSLAPIPYGINVLKMVGRHLHGHYRRLLRQHQGLTYVQVAGVSDRCGTTQAHPPARCFIPNSHSRTSTTDKGEEQ